MRTFILIIIAAILNIFAAGLSASGMSEEKKTRIAQVACAEIKETRGMDGALRVRRVNEARELIGGEVFLEGDEEIVRSVRWGVCELLILDFAAYQTTVNEYERIAAEKRAEEERIAAEKRAEQERIAAEKRAEEERMAAERRAEEERIAAEQKRIAAENYKTLANNILNSKSAEEMKRYCEEYESKQGELNRGGSNLEITVRSEVGRYFECWVEKDGKEEGLERRWWENGQLVSEANYVNGKKEGLWRAWHRNGQLRFELNYVDEKKEGLERVWLSNGQLYFESCYRNGEKVDMSNCR